MDDAEEIEHRVRSGKREEIPDSQGNQNLRLLSSLIEVSWSQNPNDRPTFKQIAQKLAS